MFLNALSTLIYGFVDAFYAESVESFFFLFEFFSFLVFSKLTFLFLYSNELGIYFDEVSEKQTLRLEFCFFFILAIL